MVKATHRWRGVRIAKENPETKNDHKKYDKTLKKLQFRSINNFCYISLLDDLLFYIVFVVKKHVS